MKTIFSKIIIGATIAMLAACSHNDTAMFTKINSDGSCYREITIPADSAFLAGDTAKRPFPVKLDSTWSLVFATNKGAKSRIEPYTKGRTYVVDTALNKNMTARKNYPTVNSLTTFRLDDSVWDTLATKISFTKKFRWFYTYYAFSETYPKTNPLLRVSINNYLTPEEILTLYGENKNLFTGKNGVEIKDLLNSIEEKGNAWLNRSYYEEFFHIILKYFRLYKEMPVDSATFAQAKNQIYKLNKDSLKSDNMAFEELFNQYFHTKKFTAIKNPKEVEEAMINELPEFDRYFKMNIHYSLSIPGKTIETNTQVIKGDTLAWKVDGYRIFFTEYTLHAKSRKPNVWAFAVTGLFILLVAGSFWIKRDQSKSPGKE